MKTLQLLLLSILTLLPLGLLHCQTVDDFNPGADNRAYSLTAQTDGKVLVSGLFNTLGAQPRAYIGRLNSDGVLDGSFSAGANSWVTSLAIQTDGKILLTGGFSAINGSTRHSIARLNANGSLDSLNLGPNSWIVSMAMQSDDKIR
jgi:uncharacterized delta-60 repeat protein